MKEELTVSKEILENVQTESQEQKKELQDVKNTYIEQKTSYEEQLNEAEKQNKSLKITTAVSATVSFILSVVLVIVIL